MTEKSNAEYLSFWGKAKSKQAMLALMHPVAYHCLDVAAVAEQMQYLRHHDINRICTKFNIPPNDFMSLNTLLIALHDIGKFSRTFQGLVSEHWPKILGDEVTRDPNTSHWQLSYEILLNSPLNLKLNQAISPSTQNALKCLLGAVSGHHGRPPADSADIFLNRRQVCEKCKTQAEAFLDDLLLLLPPPQCAWLTEETARELSFWLSGLTNTADWIGSNENIFKFEDKDKSLAEYWRTIAQPRAKEAMLATGLTPATPVKNASLKKLFKIDKPRPMQAELEALSLPDGPVLVVIEDATGSGKTEAATLLAQKMMHNGKGGGLYFALPTMATANAMYQRMAENFRNLFEPETTPSLALAHGKRELMLENFKDLNLPGEQENVEQNTNEIDSLIADCADWIADDRRRTFFAQIGVGTIDQALMAILPVKFQALRLWALSDRILIIDEAHAYDTYMSKELESLLKFHAVNGSSVIILTATLTRKQREDLVNAYEQGLRKNLGGTASNNELDSEQTSMAYPLVTIVSQNNRELIETIPPASHTIRTININRLSNEGETIEKIKQAAKKGAAVAWVRNAVDDAIRAYSQLKAEGVLVDLFHARFIMGDRQIREQDAIKHFGPESSPMTREGRVLIATQVIEQSLDLDFDLMISDLAPVDLLVQRAGRLWRHMHIRPAEKRPVDGPLLHILSPDPNKVECSKWLHQLDIRGRYTYPNHALLWRTAHKLFGQGQVNIPEDLRNLLEYVYSDPPSTDTPSCLEEYDAEAEGNEWGDSSMAKINILKLEKGYTLQGKWQDDEPTPTRLGEPTQTVRLAKINTQNQLEPYFQSKQSPHHSWALSEVSIRSSKLHGLQPCATWQAAIDATLKTWPKSQRFHLLVPVDNQGLLLFDYPNAESKRLVYGPSGLEETAGQEL